MKYFLISVIALFFSANLSAQGYEPSDTATDFSLLNVDGKKVSLSDYSDVKGYVVIFTCNHCPFSVAYEDRIIALDKEAAALGFKLVALNPNDSVQYPDDSYSAMIRRASEKGFTFPYLLDATQEYAKAYGAQKTPHVFVLQKENGVLIVKYIGAIDNNFKDAAAADRHYVTEALKEILAGQPVSTPVTKAIGCGVKWKAN